MFLVFLTSILVFFTGSGDCHPRLYTVVTIGAYSTAATATSATNAATAAAADASRLITCASPPNSFLLIRTAYYLSNSSSSSSSSSSSFSSDAGNPGQKWSVWCQDNGYGGCSRDHLFVRGDRMTSDDVMKVYRHCRDRRPASSWWCDASEAGVGREFVMSYYCLEEPFINPCSNLTWEPLTDNSSVLFNYPQHSKDCDLSCQCTITSDASDSEASLQIQALNLFQEEREEDLEHDGNGSKPRRQFPDAGSSVTEGCVGRKEQPKPRVLIESSQRRWEVKRRAVPVQWQLKGNESSSLSLVFRGLHGIRSGRLWMNFKGPRMEISCGYTVQHGTPLPQRSTPSPPDKSFVSPHAMHSQQVLTYVGVGGALAIALTVVIIIAVAKCKVRAGATKQSRPKGHLLQPDPSTDEFRHYSVNDIPLGDYCPIKDVTSASGAAQPHVIRAQSRDDKPPPPPTAKEEEGETTFPETSASESGTAIVEADQERGRDLNSEYGTLNHGLPRAQESNLERAGERVIYDHVGAFGSVGDGDYQCLRHCVSIEPRVIDNIYDTVTNMGGVLESEIVHED